MPVRLAIERRAWDSAASLELLPQSAPHVAALVYWARAIGQARAGHPRAADAEVDRLSACLRALQSAGNTYWAMQVEVLLKEAQAWRLVADGQAETALVSLRAAADEEDAVEKLPVTPGPVVPAREQLGELLLDLNRPQQALAGVPDRFDTRAGTARSPGRCDYGGRTPGRHASGGAAAGAADMRRRVLGGVAQ